MKMLRTIEKNLLNSMPDRPFLSAELNYGSHVGNTLKRMEKKSLVRRAGVGGRLNRDILWEKVPIEAVPIDHERGALHERKKREYQSKRYIRSPEDLDGYYRNPYLNFDEKLKEMVREKFDRKCSSCGKTEQELGKRLDVHHIDGNKRNANISNLTALCHHCHMSLGSCYMR